MANRNWVWLALGSGWPTEIETQTERFREKLPAYSLEAIPSTAVQIFPRAGFKNGGFPQQIGLFFRFYLCRQVLKFCLRRQIHHRPGNPHPATRVQNARRCQTLPSQYFFSQTPARSGQFRSSAVILPAKTRMVQLVFRLLSLEPHSECIFERRVIGKINNMIGTEPDEADVTQASVYDCGAIPANCLYIMVLDLCMIDKTLVLCSS